MLLKTNKLKLLLVNRRQPGWLELIKITSGLMVFAALASFSRLDPSLFNLLSPQGEISNCFGLPGALLAGLINDIFGQMAFLIPILMVFASSKNGIVSWKTTVSIILELFLIVTLVSFVLSKANAELTVYTGLWGHVSNASLSDPFWKNVSLVIILGYQLLFFRLIRLNPILLVVLFELFKLGKHWFFRLMLQVNLKVKKFWKFSSLNWFEPLKSLLAKNYEKSILRMGNASEFFWRQFVEIKKKKKIVIVFSNGISNDKAKYNQKVISELQSATKNKTLILLKSIRKYEECHLISDTNNFLSECRF